MGADVSRMDEALRRAGHSAAISLAPAPTDSASAHLVEPVIELDDYVAEVSVDARHVDDRHVDDRAPEPPAVSDSADGDGDAEVEAMHAISRVLTGLPNADARARVLRWAAESFVEGGLQPACCERAAASGRLSANSMIHSFVADFQQLVRDWHGCFDHPDVEPDVTSAPPSDLT
jgi:hypothetical protein